MFRRREVQAPGQSGCGELTAWVVMAVLTAGGLGIWGIIEMVGA